MIAARPSVGKTLFALNLALKQVQMGFKVAFFSMEMDNKEIVQRILARNSGLRLRAFRNKIEDNEKMEKVGKAMEELEVQLKTLYLFDNIYYKSKIERKIRRLKAKVNIDLVYIDYLGLIKGKANENKYQVVSEISRDLKQLARELKITIVCLAQLNREMEKR
ncbi:MAG: DnaB-like helicase C-terminal domain-containing protein [Candidatus Peribacteria bacterium]|nr:DnaB-like helicase C-terminal domain-containing protein [Candidatus Peribacteria bacterium]